MPFGGRHKTNSSEFVDLIIPPFKQIPYFQSQNCISVKNGKKVSTST